MHYGLLGVLMLPGWQVALIPAELITVLDIVFKKCTNALDISLYKVIISSI